MEKKKSKVLLNTNPIVNWAITNTILAHSIVLLHKSSDYFSFFCVTLLYFTIIFITIYLLFYKFSICYDLVLYLSSRVYYT